MTDKLIVGKTYRYRSLQVIVECMYASDKIAVVKHLSGEESTISPNNYHYWEEYREPVITERWVNIYGLSGHSSKEIAEQYQDRRYPRQGMVKLTYVDGVVKQAELEKIDD